MLLTGEQSRIIQIHVTRRCNLRCVHCYSSSSPEERDAMPFSLIRDAILDAADLGYNAVSFSGGEPLLRADLPQLTAVARAQGMAVALVTNGLALTPKKAAELKDAADLVAISLDGAPERHDRMRALPGAFQQLIRKLPLLRDVGIPFAFVFTLTRANLHELEWAARFAHSEGATQFHIHPLEATGRAAGQLAEDEPDEETMLLAWLLTQRLRQIYADRMNVEIDLSNVLAPPFSAEEAMSRAEDCRSSKQTLAHFLSPLVLEADGYVAPLRYAFPRGFGLGSLRSARLSRLADDWIPRHAIPLAELYDKTLVQARNAEPLVVNLYDLLVRAAAERKAELPVYARSAMTPGKANFSTRFLYLPDLPGYRDEIWNAAQ